ncbi:MAG TPA: hypothetical protein PJ982_15080, partial [Lacipirellulaceae bacterium]|nr:hypothetical protein [Lacipirellulaceae bacterium]
TAGTTTVAASVVLDGATLQMDLNNTNQGLTSDKFQVQGPTTLQGSLVVHVDAPIGYSPSGNVSVLSATNGIVNNASSLSLAGPAAALFSGVSVVGNELVLLSAAGIPGDFNNDGRVDGADFLVWQRGQSPTSMSPADLMTWRTNFGAPGVAASAGGVPEPGAAIQLVLLASMLVPIMRR